MVSTPTPLVSPLSSPEHASSTIRRFEPALRWLSIAAAVVFLVLGGVQLTNNNVDNNDVDNLAGLQQGSETDADGQTSKNQEPLQRGEVSQQGDAASEGPVDALTGHVDTPNQATDNGLTALEMTTVAVGILALVLIAGWILVHYRAGTAS